MRVLLIRPQILIYIIWGILWSSPSLALCALPYQITNGQPADATQLMANLSALSTCISGVAGGSQNSIQYKDSNGNLAGIGPLTNGQIIIGSTGNPAQAATISPGSGITIANTPGNITISAVAGTSVLREFGPYAPPLASSFTFIDNAGQTSPTINNEPSVGLVYSVPLTSGSTAFPGVYRPVPQNTTWSITIRYKYMLAYASYPSFGLVIKDDGGRMIAQIPENGAMIVKRQNSNTSYNSNVYGFTVYDAPQWSRVGFDGTNINFAISWDGQNWLNTYSESSTAFLNGNLQWVGLGGLTTFNDTSLWKAGSTTGGLVTYWDATDDPASSRVAP